jgi:hypothetical protein
MSKMSVEDMVCDMLKKDISGKDGQSGKIVMCYDDWDSMKKFGPKTEAAESEYVESRVYVRCAFINKKSDNAKDYAWYFRDQTSTELDVTDTPKPSEGADAVVECDVIRRIDSELVEISNPKIVGFQIADSTKEKLEKYLKN